MKHYKTNQPGQGTYANHVRIHHKQNTLDIVLCIYSLFQIDHQIVDDRKMTFKDLSVGVGTIPFRI